MFEKITQQQRILNLLLYYRNEWVSLPRILDLRISQYGRVMGELRGQGRIIQNKTKMVDGQKHSWFRLLTKEYQKRNPLFAGVE